MFWGKYLKRRAGLFLTIAIGFTLFFIDFFSVAVTDDPIA
jgi:two-component system sensor histidine kinase BraS/BceS